MKREKLGSKFPRNFRTREAILCFEGHAKYMVNDKWTGSYLVLFYSTWLLKVFHIRCLNHTFTCIHTSTFFLHLTDIHTPMNILESSLGFSILLILQPCRLLHHFIIIQTAIDSYPPYETHCQKVIFFFLLIHVTLSTTQQLSVIFPQHFLKCLSFGRPLFFFNIFFH